MSETVVAAIQMKMTNDPAENLARAETWIREATARGATAGLISLPGESGVKKGASWLGKTWRTWITRSPRARAASITRAALAAASSMPTSAYLPFGK